ncbi:S8 family peptidase [Natronorubrum thiooxidans]|nr:S8 family peptidase [Natronorubrum thiooxidans]
MGDEDDVDRYVVGMEPGTVSANVSREATTVYRTLSVANGGAMVGTFSDAARRELADRADVRYVEPDHVRRSPTLERTSLEATDVQPDEQQLPWGIERIGATEFREQGDTDNRGRVAILDSGIDPEHETLEVADGIAFADCNDSTCENEWDDDSGHGTHCAGTVAALDNDIGVIGVSPATDLCSVKILAGDGSGYDSDIAAGIEWCTDNDVDVISLSLGGSEPAQVLEDALEYAYQNGSLVVAAAGNTGPVGQIDYPAKYEQCIAVGATNDRDEVPSWSVTGDELELVAPGEAILSTSPGDEYTYLDGTSMSTPHVAGVAAQLMGQGMPNAEDTDNYDDPGGVRGLLRKSADDLGLDESEQGYGLLNAVTALEEIELVTTETPTGVRASTATFRGTLRDLGDADAVDARFRWREAGGDDWTETESETLTSSGEFQHQIDALDPDTEYDVRAVVDPADEGPIAGTVVSFATGLDSLAVETSDVEVHDHRTVQLNGVLAGLGDAETADVSFLVRSASADADANATADRSSSVADSKETEPQTLDAVGEFDAELSGLAPETEYEVEALCETDEATETGDPVSFVTDPEPGLPEIDRLELTDDSTGQFVRCRVRWAASVDDGAIELVTARLRYADEDEVLHEVTAEVDAGEENGVLTVRNSDRLEGAGEDYDVTLIVTDTEGETTEETARATLDERSPPPTIDRFDTTPDDFLGTPEIRVEWAVSDDGGELDGVELELRRPDESAVIDAASSMARGDETTGEESLRDRNGAEGDEYEITIRVTDYFEQTTEEMTRTTFE